MLWMGPESWRDIDHVLDLQDRLHERYPSAIERNFNEVVLDLPIDKDEARQLYKAVFWANDTVAYGTYGQIQAWERARLLDAPLLVANFPWLSEVYGSAPWPDDIHQRPSVIFSCDNSTGFFSNSKEPLHYDDDGWFRYWYDDDVFWYDDDVYYHHVGKSPSHHRHTHLEITVILPLVLGVVLLTIAAVGSAYWRRRRRVIMDARVDDILREYVPLGDSVGGITEMPELYFSSTKRVPSLEEGPSLLE